MSHIARTFPMPDKFSLIQRIEKLAPLLKNNYLQGMLINKIMEIPIKPLHNRCYINEHISVTVTLLGIFSYLLN